MSPTPMKKSSMLAAALAVLTLSLSVDAQVAPATQPQVLGDAAVPQVKRSKEIPSPELEKTWKSIEVGLELQPPSGGRKIVRNIGNDEVARWVDEGDRWVMTIARIELPEPLPLIAAPEDGRPQGFAETALSNLRKDAQSRLIDRSSTYIDRYNAVKLIVRDRANNDDHLTQQVIIQRSERHYYLLTLRTSIGRGELESDPMTQWAAEMFNDVVDSIKVIDLSEVVEMQTLALESTRSLMVNWTQAKILSTIQPETWLRVVRDGKDVGYSYIVEEAAADLPRAAGDKGKANPNAGFRVGIRSRSRPDAGMQVDSESWMWVAFDRRQEIFNTIVLSDIKGETSATHELGTTFKRMRVQSDPTFIQGAKQQEEYVLEVQTLAKQAGIEPLKKPLPPYYVPQALGHLLPRLLPLRSPRTYLFGAYIADQRAVMLRYVTVKPLQSVKFNNSDTMAIVVEDRVGLEGSATNHYFDPDGKFLGSENKDLRLLIVPSDAPTLEKIWQNLDLSRPGSVEAKR